MRAPRGARAAHADIRYHMRRSARRARPLRVIRALRAASAACFVMLIFFMPLRCDIETARNVLMAAPCLRSLLYVSPVAAYAARTNVITYCE